MKEEINLYGMIMLILAGTILSTLAVNYIIIQYGVTNDYIFVKMQEITEEFQNKGMFTNTFNVSNMTQKVGEAYQQSITWFDNLWFFVYIMFIIITFGIAYRVKDPTEVNFLMLLLYGIFIFLFVGYLTGIFVDWFINNVTLKLLPGALEYFPKFKYYIDNAGVINFIHALVLLILSRINFQYSLKQSIEKQELESIDNEEIS